MVLLCWRGISEMNGAACADADAERMAGRLCRARIVQLQA